LIKEERKPGIQEEVNRRSSLCRCRSVEDVKQTLLQQININSVIKITGEMDKEKKRARTGKARGFKERCQQEMGGLPWKFHFK
jgi:hypothetical protein